MASTSDLGLAAALIALGYTFTGLERGEDRKLFCFDTDDQTIIVLNTQYISGSLLIDAFRHAESLRRLKHTLRSASVPIA